MSFTRLTLEQQQVVKLIDDHAAKFPFSKSGDEQLLQTCYDYLPDFKQVIDSTSKPQLDYICQEYEGFYRFAKLMEMLAQGIADGVIDVPKDH